MTDLRTQALTYLAIERELETRVSDWVMRLNHAGIKADYEVMSDNLRRALFQEVREAAESAHAFQASVEVVEAEARNLKEATADE
jgi:hypothetical protein